MNSKDLLPQVLQDMYGRRTSFKRGEFAILALPLSPALECNRVEMHEVADSCIVDLW